MGSADRPSEPLWWEGLDEAGGGGVTESVPQTRRLPGQFRGCLWGARISLPFLWLSAHSLPRSPLAPGLEASPVRTERAERPGEGPSWPCPRPRAAPGSLPPRSRPPGSYLSSADPWLWWLVRREKTFRSLRGRVGGDEGGVNPTSVDLASGDRAASVRDHGPARAPLSAELPEFSPSCPTSCVVPQFATSSKCVCSPETTPVPLRSVQTRGQRPDIRVPGHPGCWLRSVRSHPLPVASTHTACTGPPVVLVLRCLQICAFAGDFCLNGPRCAVEAPSRVPDREGP